MVSGSVWVFAKVESSEERSSGRWTDSRLRLSPRGQPPQHARGSLGLPKVPCRLSRMRIGSLSSNLVQQLTTVPDQCAVPCLQALGNRRVLAVLRNRPANAFDPCRCLWPGAQPTVKPTTAVRHCRTLATRPTPGLRPTARRPGEVARPISVPEPAPSRFMGYWSRAHSLDPSPGGVVPAVTAPTIAWPPE
jgi:hypothetical protein